jgi:hypothetical protein
LLQLQILSGLCEICFGHVDYYYYYYYPMTWGVNCEREFMC